MFPIFSLQKFLLEDYQKLMIDEANSKSLGYFWCVSGDPSWINKHPWSCVGSFVCIHLHVCILKVRGQPRNVRSFFCNIQGVYTKTGRLVLKLASFWIWIWMILSIVMKILRWGLGCVPCYVCVRLFQRVTVLCALFTVVHYLQY